MLSVNDTQANDTIQVNIKHKDTQHNNKICTDRCRNLLCYEESVVDKFKSNLLLVIFWLNIINYNS